MSATSFRKFDLDGSAGCDQGVKKTPDVNDFGEGICGNVTGTDGRFDSVCSCRFVSEYCGEQLDDFDW